MNRQTQTHPKYNNHNYYYAIAFYFLYFLLLSCTKNLEKTSSTKDKMSINQIDTISLMVYNVENVFDMIDNGTEYKQYKPGKNNWTHETCSQKLSNIASVIVAANPDIAVLCEIENAHAASLLKKKVRKLGCSYKYLISGEKPNPATVCQTIFSKYPIIFSKGHGVPKQGAYHTRNILEVDIKIGQDTLKIFALHWPSKRYRESYRIKTSKVLIKRINQLPDNCDYIITGDFNSNYNEAETFFTAKLDNTNGKTAINHLLRTVKSHPDSSLDFFNKREVLKQLGKPAHYQPWLELPSHQRFSYIYKGQRNTLDHILLPKGLFDSIGVSYLNNSFSQFTWHGRLLYDGVPFRWQISYKHNGSHHLGKGYSDHLPIIARLTTHPFTFDNTKKTTSTQEKRTVSKKGGFENGVEGWIPGSNNFRLNRDTISPAQGLYSLKLEGHSRKSERAAYIRMPVNKTKNPKTISFQLRGKGKFAFRLRIDKKPFLCYSNEGFKHKIKSTRYTTFASDSWQTINLDLPKALKFSKIIDLEIRVAGNKFVKIWIDDVRVE